MLVHCPPDSVLQQCLIYKEELGRCQQVNPKFFRSKRLCKDLLIYRLRDLEITQKPAIGMNVLNAYFKVFQANQSRCKGGYILSVTATPFVNTDTGMEDYKTDVPFWYYNGHATETKGLEITPSIKETAGKGSYEATVTYTTGSPVALGTELFTIAYGWKYKEDLPAGPYKATVTLSFSAL